MRSKKSVGYSGGSCHTFKGFKTPKEMKKWLSPPMRQEVNRIQNKRARSLNYSEVYQYDFSELNLQI